MRHALAFGWALGMCVHSNQSGLDGVIKRVEDDEDHYTILFDNGKVCRWLLAHFRLRDANCLVCRRTCALGRSFG